MIWGKRYVRGRSALCVDGGSVRSKQAQELIEDSGFEVRKQNSQLIMTLDETEKFLEWMGEPIPGYEYKWENKNYMRYKEEIK